MAEMTGSPHLRQLLSLLWRERFQIAGDRWKSLARYGPEAPHKNGGQQKDLNLHIPIMRVKVDLRPSKLIGIMIGQVAKESGLAASAIRFYEQAGVLPKPFRVGGRRRYDPSILERLAVLERTKACGFSLAEMRQLFYGFPHGTPPSERWHTLARRKIDELEQLEAKIAATKELLLRSCSCTDLAESGRRIFAKKHATRKGP
jgi:MerR family redox-sensitive transcriptional activator SoxR